MFHTSILILICCILLSQKIILINEESLILLCFAITVSIVKQNFNSILDSSINDYIAQESLKLKQSFSLLIQTLENTKNLGTKNVTASTQYIINYKNYWLLFCKNFLVWLSLNSSHLTQTNYSNLFISLKHTEQKLIVFFYSQLYTKLYKQTVLNEFLTFKLSNLKSRSKNWINLRNWIKKQNYLLHFKT